MRGGRERGCVTGTQSHSDRLRELILAPSPEAGKIGEYLDGIPLAAAIAAIRSLSGRRLQRALWSPVGWTLIARAREVRADAVGGNEAYDEALALEPEHAHALLGKGRLLLRQALKQRAFNASDSEEVTTVGETAERGSPPSGSKAWRRMVRFLTILESGSSH